MDFVSDNYTSAWGSAEPGDFVTWLSCYQVGAGTALMDGLIANSALPDAVVTVDAVGDSKDLAEPFCIQVKQGAGLSQLIPDGGCHFPSARRRSFNRTKRWYGSVGDGMKSNCS